MGLGNIFPVKLSGKEVQTFNPCHDTDCSMTVTPIGIKLIIT